MTDTNTIMRGMGFPDSEQGPYVTALRTSVAKQVERGMIGRSGGTWAPGSEELTFEQRAKAQLAFDWAADNGYSYRVENIDGRIIDKRYNVRTGKTTRKINFKYILPTIGDTFRRIKFNITKPFLPKNPYV